MTTNKPAPELFLETRSELFFALASIMNELHAGKPLTRRQLKARIPHVQWLNGAVLDNVLDSVFVFDEETGLAHSFMDAPVPLQPSSLELSWLKAMLEDERAAFLLEDDLREKIAASLKSVEPYPWQGGYQPIRGMSNDAAAEPLRSTLAVAWHALTHNHAVHYRNRAFSGVIYEGDAAICRMEYDAGWNAYRLILWQSAPEPRAFKVNPLNLLELRELQEQCPPDLDDKFRRFLGQKTQTLTLQVSDYHNAAQRCLALFAPYDKQAAYAEDTGLYTLKISYYAFDRSEVLEHILSLGSGVKVLSPASLRREIKDRLQAALAAMEQNDSPKA